MHVKDGHEVAELRRLARQTTDGRLRTRMQALALAKQDHTAVHIAELLGMSRRMVQKWVWRYNKDGLVGLSERLGRGRACRLSENQQLKLKRRIEEGPREGDGVCTLRGADIQEILKQEFGVLYHLNGVYAMLHRLGYSCLMPRPKHRKADLEAQEAFKKTSRCKSKRSAMRIRGNASKSGSKMRPGLDSKEH